MLGTVQNVPSETLKQFDIKQEVWYVNCIWEKITEMVSKQKIAFKGIPKFPGMRRDLALVIDKAVQYTQILKAVNQTNSALLQDINIFDVFENEKLGVDKKSYAISLEFMHPDRTLTDADVQADVAKIMESLDKNCGAIIRS